MKSKTVTKGLRPRREMGTNTESESAADSVRVYLDSISLTPLLTADEEVTLAKEIEAGVYARQLLDGLTDGESVHLQSVGSWVDVDELRSLADAGERARRRFLSANLRLVVSLARRYPRGSLSLLDLVQEGNLGLIRAVEKFDYHRGFKFSTYATWWIRQSISRAIAQSGRIIRLPVHLGEEVGRMTRARRDLVRDLGREVSDVEVAEVLGCEVARVTDLARLAKDPVSLQTPIGAEEESALEDFVRDAILPGPDEVVLAAHSAMELMNWVDGLDDRSRAVVRARYGMEDGEVHTFAEIGHRLGLSRARIQQIEREAILRLRRLAEEHGVDAA